jgi:hypothetical protein
LGEVYFFDRHTIGWRVIGTPSGTARQLGLEVCWRALGDARRAIWRGNGLLASSFGAIRRRFAGCPARPEDGKRFVDLDRSYGLYVDEKVVIE